MRAPRGPGLRECLHKRHGRHLTGQSRVAPRGVSSHNCNAAVSLSVVLTVEYKDPAFHPRAAAVGKLGLAAGGDERRGWKPKLARMK